jgi:hypothetical protein
VCRFSSTRGSDDAPPAVLGARPLPCVLPHPYARRAIPMSITPRFVALRGARMGRRRDAGGGKERESWRGVLFAGLRETRETGRRFRLLTARRPRGMRHRSPVLRAPWWSGRGGRGGEKDEKGNLMCAIANAAHSSACLSRARTHTHDTLGEALDYCYFPGVSLSGEASATILSRGGPFQQRLRTIPRSIPALRADVTRSRSGGAASPAAARACSTSSRAARAVPRRALSPRECGLPKKGPTNARSSSGKNTDRVDGVQLLNLCGSPARWRAW